jgi:hypothetical protein
VKRFGDEPALHDSNRGRENSVQSGAPSLRTVTPSGKIDMRTLREGVHTGIGAAGAMNAHGLRTNLFDGSFEMVLNPIAVPLALPAGKRRAIIRDDQL